jgi:hypothetical protein
MAEIERADPGTRRFALVSLVIAAGLGTAALVVLDSFHQSLLSWFLAHEPDVRVTIIAIALLVLLMPLLLMAGWVWRYGGRVLRASRHPPQGVKVIRDTPVIHGARARLYGRLYQALAAVLVLAALSVLWVSWMLWRLQ